MVENKGKKELNLKCTFQNPKKKRLHYARDVRCTLGFT